jgi:hypothetical protein
MRRLVVCILLLVLVGAAFPAQARGQSTEGLELAYTLTLRAPDVVDVEVQLRGAPPGETVLGFGPMASFLGAIPDIGPLFSVVSASAPDGSELAWRWNERDVVVVNGSLPEFTLTYTINGDRLHKGGTPERFAIFRPDMLMFAPCDVLPFPRTTPSRISLRLNKPEGLQVFSSLREKDGAFEAAPGLWGNLLWDFQMAYFLGGRNAKTETHTTEWGDTYLYVSFGERRNEPGWYSPQAYMDLMESIDKHFRDAVGPQPPRKVILFDHQWAPGQPEVKYMVDCYHYMQVVPVSSAVVFLVHHVFHAYSFFPNKSKMGFSFFRPPGVYLSEGLPTYLELVTTAQLTGETHWSGKLVEFYALNARGAPWGIAGNWQHVTYNVSALKVLSLDQHIRAATGGRENLDTFLRNLWDVVKDRTTPAEVSNEELREAYTRTVGASDTYLFDLGTRTEFSKADIADLLPAFDLYCDWMANAGFARSRLLFLMYLDIAAAKGDNWPHYATYPHNFPMFQPEALEPVNAYLVNLNRTTLTQADVLAAMKASTGKDHAGFFEFWLSLGIELNPTSLGPLIGRIGMAWAGQGQPQQSPGEPPQPSADPGAPPPQPSADPGAPPQTSAAARLETEHTIGGLAQKAAIVLDEPAPTDLLGLGVRVDFGQTQSRLDLATQALTGANVSLGESRTDGPTALIADLIVQTRDPEHRRFPFTLTLPPPGTSMTLTLYLNPTPYQGHINLPAAGWLAGPPPVERARFEFGKADAALILPETSLPGAKYQVTAGAVTVDFAPGAMLRLADLPAGATGVRLVDKDGVVRGIERLPKTSQGVVWAVLGAVLGLTVFGATLLARRRTTSRREHPDYGTKAGG